MFELRIFFATDGVALIPRMAMRGCGEDAIYCVATLLLLLSLCCKGFVFGQPGGSSLQVLVCDAPKTKACVGFPDDSESASAA